MKRRAKRIEIVVPEENEAVRGALRGFLAAAAGQSWECHYRQLPPGEVGRPLEDAAGWDADGVVVGNIGSAPVAGASSYLRGRAVVAFGYHEEVPPGWTLVPVDDAAIGAVAARHLRDGGRRHLVTLVVEGHAFARQRAGGFSQELSGQGATVLEYPAFPEAKTLARDLRRLPRPIGLFACCDLWGAQCLDACRLAGLSVPGDVAVLGCDDNAFFCELARPALSSVMVPWEALGRALAAAMQSRLARTSSPGLRPTPIGPVGVRLRLSSGRGEAADPVVAKALECIRQRSAGALSVPDVARVAGVNRRALERAFRRQLECGVLGEIHRARADRACELLRDPRLQVAEVAERCGGLAPQAFASFFKRMRGASPLQYRRLVLRLGGSESASGSSGGARAVV